MDGRMDDERSGVDALALVASAGGMGALTIVLRSLPADIPVAVVVQQHLSSHGSALVRILRQRTDHEIAWAADGAALRSQPPSQSPTPASAPAPTYPSST